MWRRLSTQFRTLSPLRSTPKSNRLSAVAAATSLSSSPSPSPADFRPTVPLFSRHFSTASEFVVKTVEEVMPIATGHEREELEAQLQGKDILDINFPEGPFGTKDNELFINKKQMIVCKEIVQEAPAVIKSYYDKRIVGCPGDEGEDEHDVVWFWLEKGKPHECPVCSQYFVLEVVGPGGPPDGHGDDHHHH